ncbi:MAG TPA: protein kinase [Polyangiaceae bacterium]|nr:protein kinase [Polyangiaceae bacterium]
MAPSDAPLSSGPHDAVRCLSDEDLAAYLEGSTSAALRDRIDRHLDTCTDCWLLVLAQLSAEPVVAPFRITTFAVGSKIAQRYRVERFIGKGGMGEVYLAHDELMNRPVALKTPLCSNTDDPSALRKFFDEARNADRITHANICRIHALQEHRDPSDGRPPIPFFTMEFIAGETLARRIKQGPLPLPMAELVAQQLLSGLQAAHEKRVLHLDFKSDNIMLRHGAQPEAVIMDFGLSRQRDAQLRSSQCEGGVGTLPYMALEQLEGGLELTPAVDVHAFGVVLFEMLTGRLPFLETSIGALLLRQSRERPPLPSSLRPELSDELDEFLLRCMHRSAAKRYADAGAALTALRQLRSWVRSPSRARVRWRWAVALGLAALLSAPAALQWMRRRPPAQRQLGSARASALPAPSTTPTSSAPAAAPAASAPLAPVTKPATKPAALPAPHARGAKKAPKPPAPARPARTAPHPVEPSDEPRAHRQLHALPSAPLPFGLAGGPHQNAAP